MKQRNSPGNMLRPVIHEREPYSSMDYMDDDREIDFSNDPSSLHEKAKVMIMFNHWHKKQQGIDVHVEGYSDLNAKEPDINSMGKLKVGRTGQLQLYTIGEWVYSPILKGMKNIYSGRYDVYANGMTRSPNRFRWYTKE